MWSYKIIFLNLLLVVTSMFGDSNSDNSTSTTPPPASGNSQGWICKYKGPPRKWSNGQTEATKSCCGKGECKWVHEGKEEGYTSICIVNGTDRVEAVKNCCSKQGKNKGDYVGAPRKLIDRKFNAAMNYPC